MIIPINLLKSTSSSEGGHPPQLAQFGTDEVVLIELQGALEVEGDRTGQYVGKLTVDSSLEKSTLLIGHHLLEGKLVKLNKPLAVLHRTSSAGGTEWDVVVVVKRKMVFSKRPMPVVDIAIRS